MKKIFLSLLFLLSLTIHAQFEDIFASGSDADKFVNHYTAPFLKGMMSAANASWVTSAKPIKPFHFEINLSASGAFVPPEKENFTFDENEYQFIRIDSGPASVPTVMGGESQTRLKIVIPLNNSEIKLLDFEAPSGVRDELPLNIIPAPTFQVAMGLPLGSEVNLRYAPKLTNEDGAYFTIIGLGVKHSLSQYFKKKSKFNLAGHLSYQHIGAGVDEVGNNKAVHFSINTISLQGIASLDYPIISLYSKLGFTQGFTNLDVLGTYDYTYDVQDNNGNHIRYETVSVTDPLKLSQDLNGLKLGVGFKLKLAFFQVFADYTLQEFPVANLGLGVKF